MSSTDNIFDLRSYKPKQVYKNNYIKDDDSSALYTEIPYNDWSNIPPNTYIKYVKKSVDDTKESAENTKYCIFNRYGISKSANSLGKAYLILKKRDNYRWCIFADKVLKIYKKEDDTTSNNTDNNNSNTTSTNVTQETLTSIEQKLKLYELSFKAQAKNNELINNKIHIMDKMILKISTEQKKIIQYLNVKHTK